MPIFNKIESVNKLKMPWHVQKKKKSGLRAPDESHQNHTGDGRDQNAYECQRSRGSLDSGHDSNFLPNSATQP